MIRFSARVAAWLLAAFIVYATLSPIGLRPETGGPPSIERFAAYLLLGLCFAIGYPKRRGLIAVALVLAALGLEAAQNLTATRHGRPIDALQKGSGALTGVLCAVGLSRLGLAMGRERASQDRG